MHPHSATRLAAQLTLALATVFAFPQTPPPTPQPIAAPAYGKLPLSFEANQGQAGPAVQFLSHGRGYTLLLRQGEAVLKLGSGKPQPPPAGKLPAPGTSGLDGKQDAAAIRLSLAGTNRDASATREDPQIARTNYFVGNDPARWRTNIPNYGRVRYRSIYDGIDLVYYGNQGRLEHDFIVAPHADPGRIAMDVTGVDSLRIDPASGDLLLKSGQTSLRLLKPVTYQDPGETQGRGAAAKRIPIASSYKLLRGNKVSFSIGRYDRARPLIIDPILVYSTYLGGSGSNSYGSGWGDQGNGIALDAQGSAYVVGSAGSTDFPITSGAYQTRNKPALNGSGSTLDYGPTVFVGKFNPAGTALEYSTFLGGSGQYNQYISYCCAVGYSDYGLAIAVDASKNAYVTGFTYSTDFPTTSGAFQTVNHAPAAEFSTAFVAKLSADGSSLVYSTYLGGSFGDQAGGIAVDSSGDAYVTGATWSADFPTTGGAFQTVNKGAAIDAGNAFVTKLNAAGTAEVYSTFLGGSGAQTPYGGGGPQRNYGDRGNAIVLDSAGNAYVTGSACSQDFPVTPGAYQTVNRAYPSPSGQGPSNAFVTKLNPTGTAEVYSTYLGGGPPPQFEASYSGTLQDTASAIALDSNGNAYIAGQTWSPSFPVTPGVVETEGNLFGNGFVGKLSSDGRTLDFSTYLGGRAPGCCDHDVVNGRAYQGLQGGYGATGVAVDSSGAVFVSGFANNGDFPVTQDAIVSDTLFPGSLSEKAFVVKLNPTATAVEYATLLGGSDPNVGISYFDQAYALALDASGDAFVTGSAGSSQFPVTAGAYQTVNHGQNGRGNAFVGKLALAGETASHSPTHIAISASSTLVAQDTSLTLTATVTGPSGTPTGTVTFFGYGLTSTTVPLDGSGVATATVSPYIVGPTQAYASYSGDAGNLSSIVFGTADAASFRVYGPPSQLHIGVMQYPILYNQVNVPVSVSVWDADNFGLAGIPVKFSGTGLKFAQSTVVTDSTGTATAYFTPLVTGSLTGYASIGAFPSPLAIYLPISPSPLIVTLAETSRPYGSANPALQYTFTGLLNNDVVTVTPSTTATAASPVGTYPVTATLGGANLSNYTVTLNPGSLKVTPAPLSVFASPNTQGTYYGSPLALSNAFTLTGFVNGDTASVVTGAPVAGTAATPTSPAGFYPITQALGSLAAANYSFLLKGGRYYIYAVTLNLTANSLTVTQGQPIPPLTYSLTGFVNGDTASVVSGAPTLSTAATSSSPPGQYPIAIAQGSLTAQDYRFLPVNGVLTINPSAPTFGFSPTSLTFPPTELNTTSATQVLTVTNTSSLAATVSSYKFAGASAGEFSLAGKTCVTSLAAHSSCTLTIAFRPAAASAASASLVATDSAAGSPQMVPLSGTGTAQPTISFSPTSLTFPSTSVGTAAPAQVLTVTNTSASPLAVSSYAFSGPNAGEFSIQSKTCVSALAANSSCTLTLIFKPTVSGSATASLVATDNATGSPQSVPLSGAGH